MVYVIMVWTIIVFASAYILDGPIVRLESLIGTGILLIWVIWGVNYRLQKIQQERYKQNR